MTNTAYSRIARRLDAVRPSPTLAITARAAELKAAGIDVLSFSAGEPDFPTPEHICAAARRAIDEGFTKYTAVGGIPELRKAIATNIETRFGVRYGPAEIAVTVGAKHALFNVAYALYEPGDEIVIPAPYWVTYPEHARLAGADPVVVPTAAENRFKMRPADLERALGPRTRAVILSTPSNPTGAAYDERELAALAEVLAPTSALVVTDEIYASLTYGGFRHRSFVSVAPQMKDRVLLVDGVSKSYAMTGWRIGWVAGPRHFIEAILTVQSQATSNPTSIAQRAALEALVAPQDCVEEMRRRFEVRRDLMLEGLLAIPGVRCLAPDGAFYVFPDFSEVIAKLDPAARIGNDTELAAYFLEEARVAVVPGEAFGAPGHLRLSYATGEATIREGLDRMRKSLQKIHPAG
ncbi:MAG: pyridoxal phosphate-dependent aminotransferase [Deltaproteobacteria bacterium]|nr:pyridoxal phosphate-dependent aminotransferase [Deltaproteobacteria bacterium]